MIASKHARLFALALLIASPSLVPALAGELSARAVAAQHASGQGTVLLPSLSQDGLLVAAILGEDGAHYGLDGVMTTWMPSEPVPELMFGGLYGRLFLAHPQGQEMKARVEGTWRMVGESVGEVDALVLRDSPKGAEVIGRIQGKFEVESQGADAEVQNAGGHAAQLAGALGLNMVLAE